MVRPLSNNSKRRRGRWASAGERARRRSCAAGSVVDVRRRAAACSTNRRPANGSGSSSTAKSRSSAGCTAGRRTWRRSPTARCSPRESCSTSAPTRPARSHGRRGARVLQVPHAVLDDVQHGQARPLLPHRRPRRPAHRRPPAARPPSCSPNRPRPRRRSPPTAREHDSLGEREIPNNAYYGVQTVRALENFAISGVPLRNFAHFVNALAYVKKAAAQANAELDVPRRRRSPTRSSSACDEILAGKLHDQFVVDMMQGGAGTSTNMNANEVIANRGLELMGHAKGEYQHLHPNDHVNCSQSTNDAYPTAIKLAVIFSLKDTLAAMGELRAALRAEGDGVRPRAEDGPHREPGRRPHDARTGVRRLRRDDRYARWRRWPDRPRSCTSSTWAPPPSAPASTARPATPTSSPRRLAEVDRPAADEGAEPGRSHPGLRRLRPDGRRR